MTKPAAPLTYSFINPNTPKRFEAQLRKILIARLLALQNRPEERE